MMVVCRHRTLLLKWAMANILSVRNDKWGRRTNADLEVFGSNARDHWCLFQGGDRGG